MWEVSRALLRINERPRHESLYWVLGGLAVSMGTVVDLLEDVGAGSLAGDAVYTLSALVFFLLWRRGGPRAHWYVCAHILVGMVIVAFDSHFTASPTPIMRQIHTTLATLGITGLGVYGGFTGLAMGLPLALLTHPGNASLPLTMVLVLALGITGASLNRAFRAMDAAKASFARLAHEDRLTGLGNRRAAEDIFAHYQAFAKRHQTPLLVMLWDVDNLKQVNDEDGHRAGDAYLQRFAQALRQSVRQEDVPFRLAGDEFVSLHLGLESGDVITERVRATFPDVSVGWIQVATPNVEEAFELADQAMYEDKLRRKAEVPNSTRLPKSVRTIPTPKSRQAHRG